RGVVRSAGDRRCGDRLCGPPHDRTRACDGADEGTRAGRGKTAARPLLELCARLHARRAGAVRARAVCELEEFMNPPSCMDGPLSARAFLVFWRMNRGAVMY